MGSGFADHLYATRTYQQDIKISHLDGAYSGNRRPIIEFNARAKLPRITQDPSILFRILDRICSQSHPKHDRRAVFSDQNGFDVWSAWLKFVGDIDAARQEHSTQEWEHESHEPLLSFVQSEVVRKSFRLRNVPQARHRAYEKSVGDALTRAGAAIPAILMYGGVSVRRVRPSGYGHEQNWYAGANGRADGCGNDCEWNGHVSVYGYACGGGRVSLS